MSSTSDEGKQERIKHVAKLLPELSESQLGWIEEIVTQFKRPHRFERNENSNVISGCMLEEVGDALRLHHCFSREPFSKDKFEYLLERAANLCGAKAELAPKGNPGHDITIGGERYSLKTQANKGINPRLVHISKFMELGKGQWGAEGRALIGLRDQFLSHMRSYDRILVLRNLSKAPKEWHYELVELPKALLLEAKNGDLQMMQSSRQYPKPGYCHVRDSKGELKFQLYFDGGTERKLQIKRVSKDSCIVHANWRFPAGDLVTES